MVPAARELTDIQRTKGHCRRRRPEEFVTESDSAKFEAYFILGKTVPAGVSPGDREWAN
jgi:hypothetical protein